MHWSDDTVDSVKSRPNNLALLKRRHLLASVAAAVALPATPALHAQPTSAPVVRTPQQTLGPFYPRNAAERPRVTGADLLTVEAGRVLTRGVPIYLHGRVLGLQGLPLANATIEIWQCDANAVYHHPAGGAEADRDPAFQGYGMMQTHADGSFGFRTIKPVAYPGRTPHIHVRVQTGRASLATQLYLPDNPGNARDFLYARLSPPEQAALALRLQATITPAPHPLAQHTQFTAQVDLVLG
jgi:protocatechuate 3,4-dioxygenase beta subunit